MTRREYIREIRKLITQLEAENGAEMTEFKRAVIKQITDLLEMIDDGGETE